MATLHSQISAVLEKRRPASLDALTLPRGLVALMLAPHPDDFDTIGVSMRWLQELGADILVVVARGGSGVDDMYCTPPTLEAKAALREREQRTSCQFFGLPSSNLLFIRTVNGADGQMLDATQNSKLVNQYLLSIEPDLVFIPHGNDHNTAHQIMAAMVRAGIGLCIKRPVLFLNRDPKTRAMRSDVYTPFEENAAQWKRQLLRFHDSQQQRNIREHGTGLDDRILGMNAQTARELALAAPYAEVFELELQAGK